jgi:transposase
VIGYEESEQLDVEPARYFVLATKREKRVCRSCAAGLKRGAAAGADYRKEPSERSSSD